MQVLTNQQQLPLYSIEPDETGNKQFRLYHFEGSLPNQSDLLIPHRKNHYLLVFMRRGGSRHWIDMEPFVMKENTVYFSHPNQIIVKEGVEKFWSSGIAFSSEFLSLQENDAMSRLPLIQNTQNAHELLLADADIQFVEDMLAKITVEYNRPGEWQQRMLSAYLSLLLTYLSRLYTEQCANVNSSSDKLLLRKFQAKIDECYRELKEVGDYASLLYISAGHLSEVVKNQSGKPAIKHIHERLVLEARRLLFHTNNSLKEIAFDLGFTDASYFNRFFKRETGATPAECRISFREMYH
jgi:AraC-like DNA-binding protein